MNNNSLYRQIVLEARKKKLNILKSEQKEIVKIYKDAAKKLTKKAAAAGEKTLTRRVAADMEREIRRELNNLKITLYKRNKKGLEQAAAAANEIQVKFFSNIGKEYGLDISTRFTTVFSRVPKEVLQEILNGDLYKDNKGLSSRIWWDVEKMDNDIQHMLNRAITEKKGALEFAKDLEKYVNPGAQKRPVEWEKLYGGVSKKQIDYNALRLARTSINHSYFETNRRSCEKNPYVEGMLWELSEVHYIRQIKPFGPDECDDFAEQDDYNLGTGVFPADKIPLPHPNCLCSQSGVVVKSMDEVGQELRNWLDGEENEKLNKWYAEYGEDFTN